MADNNNELLNENQLLVFGERVDRIEFFNINNKDKYSAIVKDYLAAMHDYSAQYQNKHPNFLELDDYTEDTEKIMNLDIYTVEAEKEAITKLAQQGYSRDDIAAVIDKYSPLQIEMEKIHNLIANHYDPNKIAPENERSEREKYLDIAGQGSEQAIVKNANDIKNQANWPTTKNKLIEFSGDKINGFLEKDHEQSQLSTYNDILSVIIPQKINKLALDEKSPDYNNKKFQGIKRIKHDITQLIKRSVERKKRSLKVKNFTNLISNGKKFQDHFKKIFAGTESIMVLMKPSEIYNEVSKNLNFEYLKEAKNLYGKNMADFTVKDTDVRIASNLLNKGIKINDIAKVIKDNSPALPTNKAVVEIVELGRRRALTEKLILKENAVENMTIADEFVKEAKTLLLQEDGDKKIYRGIWTAEDDIKIADKLIKNGRNPAKIAEVLKKFSPSVPSINDTKDIVKTVSINYEKILSHKIQTVIAESVQNDMVIDEQLKSLPEMTALSTLLGPQKAASKIQELMPENERKITEIAADKNVSEPIIPSIEKNNPKTLDEYINDAITKGKMSDRQIAKNAKKMPFKELEGKSTNKQRNIINGKIKASKSRIKALSCAG